MAALPPKKGPRMTRVADQKNLRQEDLENLEFEREVDAFARKVHNAIEDARGKMSDEDRERADRNAEAILKNASDAASRQRKRA